MKYPYFRGLEADRYSFYRVPKALIKVDLFEKMSGDAKLLYAVLLDRMNLSLKNGWQDENGNAYIICTIDEIMDSIRCARQKAVKLLDELEHEYAKVARAIKTVFYALDVVNQGMQEKQSITVRCMDIEDLEKQAEAIRVEQIKLYESYADGVLLRDAYIEKKKALSEKLAALQDSIRTEKEEQECADELDEEIRALTKQANEKTYIGGLTKECVDAFVSMVYLYDDQTMKIEFNCEDVIRRALEKYGA